MTSTGGSVPVNAASIGYVRDATGRVVQETTTTGSTTHTFQYTYDGAGALSGIRTAGKTTDLNLGLPGGVRDDIQSAGSTWSLPDLRSDTMRGFIPARQRLSLDKTPDGYFEIPKARVIDPSGPTVVDPLIDPSSGAQLEPAAELKSQRSLA